MTTTVATDTTSAQTTLNTPIGELKYENDYPTNETVNRLYDEMDFQRAAQAYLWSMPLVTAASIRLGLFRDLGLSCYDIVLYENFLDTKSIYFTGNNTTIYGAGIFDIAKDGPVVVEVPAGPSAGMLNDFWWRTSGIGNLGPDKGKGGKFLIVPPGYQNDLPAEGYFIMHSKMNDYMFFLRGFVVNGNVPAASELFHKTRIYPYSQRKNPKPNRVVPATGKYVNTVEPEGLAYWKLLSEVINNNPVEERDRFFIAMLKPLGIEKGKPFAPDARPTRILEEGARSVTPWRRRPVSIQDWRAHGPMPASIGRTRFFLTPKRDRSRKPNSTVNSTSAYTISTSAHGQPRQ